MSGGRLQPARVLAAFAGFSFLLHFVYLRLHKSVSQRGSASV
jgi:hypothetical protein